MDIDSKVRELFDKLEARKAKVKALKDQITASWVTNGTFRLIGSTSTVNLQTSSQDTILECATHLYLMEGATQKAAAALDIEPKGVFLGYKTSQWIADFKKRLATINLREEEAKLESIEASLNQVLSPEARRAIEVERLAKALD